MSHKVKKGKLISIINKFTLLAAVRTYITELVSTISLFYPDAIKIKVLLITDQLIISVTFKACRISK